MFVMRGCYRGCIQNLCVLKINQKSGNFLELTSGNPVNVSLKDKLNIHKPFISGAQFTACQFIPVENWPCLSAKIKH